MIFATFLLGNKETVGVVSADKKSIFPIEGAQTISMLDLISNYSEELKNKLHEKIGAGGGLPVKSVKLLAPIPHPRHDILCVGQNYLGHALEAAKAAGVEYEKADQPTFFSKRVNLAVGYDGEIPSHSTLTEKLDYEAELAVVIGKHCRNVGENEIRDYIFGYTIANDISARDLQSLHGQWTFGKGLDGFSPIGPWIVTADEFEFPPLFNIKARVNGEPRQNGHTDDLIFGIPLLISRLSQGITLEPGDILLTGTPAGVGMGFSPQKYLKSGDVVECEIDGIGLLRNVIR